MNGEHLDAGIAEVGDIRPTCFIERDIAWPVELPGTGARLAPTAEELAP